MARILVAILAVVVWAASAAAMDAAKTAAAASFSAVSGWAGFFLGPWPSALVLTWLAATTFRQGPQSREAMARSRAADLVIVMLGLCIAVSPFVPALGWPSVTSFSWVGAVMASIGLWGLFAQRAQT